MLDDLSDRVQGVRVIVPSLQATTDHPGAMVFPPSDAIKASRALTVAAHREVADALIQTLTPETKQARA